LANDHTLTICTIKDNGSKVVERDTLKSKSKITSAAIGENGHIYAGTIDGQIEIWSKHFKSTTKP